MGGGGGEVGQVDVCVRGLEGTFGLSHSLPQDGLCCPLMLTHMPSLPALPHQHNAPCQTPPQQVLNMVLKHVVDPQQMQAAQAGRQVQRRAA